MMDKIFHIRNIRSYITCPIFFRYNISCRLNYGHVDDGGFVYCLFH